MAFIWRPDSQAALGALSDRLKTAQASFEVQPRVFYEGFPKIVLYVQDVHGGTRAAVWKGVFLADNSTPGSPRIWQAEQGILVSEGPTRLHLHLVNGSTHETDAKDPDRYQISSFQQTDIPIELPAADNKPDVEPVPVSEMTTRAVARAGKQRTARYRALVPDRVPPAARLAGCVRGACPGRHPAGTLVEERRKVFRIRAGDRPGLSVLLGFLDRALAGATRTRIARIRCLARRHRIPDRWRVSAVAGRAPSAGSRAVAQSEKSVSLLSFGYRDYAAWAAAPETPSNAPSRAGGCRASISPRFSTTSSCVTSSPTWA